MTKQPTIKSLKATAKAMNINGYSVMKREALEAAIASAQQSSASIYTITLQMCARCHVVETETHMCEACYIAVDTSLSAWASTSSAPVVVTPSAIVDPFFVADPHPVDSMVNYEHDAAGYIAPAADVAATKRIAFVKADNVQLYFRADGQVVKVYWSADDYKLHIRSERRGDRITKYAQLVNMFAKLKNGVDGDVARVMKAIVRLKDMPATVKVARQKHLVEVGKVHRPQSMEKASSANRNKGTVDPQWMQRFVEFCEDTIGRRPTGLEIKSAWLEELAE